MYPADAECQARFPDGAMIAAEGGAFAYQISKAKNMRITGVFKLTGFPLLILMSTGFAGMRVLQGSHAERGNYERPAIVIH